MILATINNIEAFTYTPFEEWIVYGPFAEANTSGLFARDQYPIEQTSNQEEAFYRLVSLIANIRADFKEVSDQDWGLLNTPYTKPARAMKMSFSSTLPGLLSNPSVYYTIADVQIGFGDARTNESVPITSYFQQSTPDGVNLYFDMQADAAKVVRLLREHQKEFYTRNGIEVDDNDISIGSAVLSYVARIQVRVYDKQRKLSVYPAPLPIEKATFDKIKHSQVPSVYDDSYHTFWVRGASHFDRVLGEGY